MLLAHDDLDRALEHLVSLQDGDRGVLEVLTFGPRAIPRLRELLFRREPSGLYQSRCRVVEALAALGGKDVLIAFLNLDREIKDPVERAGEDAVLNATARALKGTQNEAVFWQLWSLAKTRKLPGAIEVLGAFRRVETLPSVIAALADDLASPAAKDAIRQFGGDAVPTLLAGVDADFPQHNETESSRRMRHAILELLLEIAEPRDIPGTLCDDLARNSDPAIAVPGCQLELAIAEGSRRSEILLRLLTMLPLADWRVRQEISDCLMKHAREALPLLQPMLPSSPPSEEDSSATAARQRILIRLAHRLRTQNGTV